jgi:hypothetical protein
MRTRALCFVAPGETELRDVEVPALGPHGYTGALSVEHEDVLCDAADGTAEAVELIAAIRPASDELNRW